MFSRETGNWIQDPGAFRYNALTVLLSQQKNEWTFLKYLQDA